MKTKVPRASPKFEPCEWCGCKDVVKVVQYMQYGTGKKKIYLGQEHYDCKGCGCKRQHPDLLPGEPSGKKE